MRPPPSKRRVGRESEPASHEEPAQTSGGGSPSERQLLSLRFGAYIRALRQSRTLTQEELAERSSLSVDSIRRLESGSLSPSLETVAKLAEGLSLTMVTLFEGFDKSDRDYIAEICDYLQTRSTREVRMAERVFRAIFRGR